MFRVFWSGGLGLRELLKSVNDRNWQWLAQRSSEVLRVRRRCRQALGIRVNVGASPVFMRGEHDVAVWSAHDSEQVRFGCGFSTDDAAAKRRV